MRDFMSERSDVKSAETHRGLRPANPHMWTVSNQDSDPNSDFPAGAPPPPFAVEEKLMAEEEPGHNKLRHSRLWRQPPTVTTEFPFEDCRPVTVARERNPPWPLQTALRGPCGRGDGEVLREFGKAGDRHNLAGGNVEDVVGTANEVHLKQTIPVVRMFDLGLKHPLQLHMDATPDPADGGRVPDELGVVVPLRGGAVRRRLPGQTRRDAVGIEGRTNEGTRIRHFLYSFFFINFG